jgi:glycosyltransferase involved in cell wall biosynthesis
VRILHVSDCYTPRVGGIETQVSGLAAAQAAAGHDVDVVTITRASGDTDPGPARVHRILEPDRPAAGGPRDRLAAVVRAARPDVVHVHGSLISPLAAAAASLAVRARLPAVLTVHSMWGRTARACYRVADGLTAWRDWPVLWTTVSQASAAAVRQLVPDGPVVVPNSVDVGFWRPDGPERLPGTGLHVVVVGRLAARKRPLDAVRALHDARRRIPGTIPLTATLVGDGPEHDQVARFLALHGMRPWVRLAGNMRPPAVRDVLADADVFLAPATLESFGIAALEARAVGLPVVARAGTGVADFVRDEQDGLLAADRGGLADALVRLACEPALRAAISTHNRRTPPIGVDLPTVVARYEACYLRAGDLVRRPPLRPVAVPGAGRPRPRPRAAPARSRRGA